MAGEIKKQQFSEGTTVSTPTDVEVFGVGQWIDYTGINNWTANTIVQRYRRVGEDIEIFVNADVATVSTTIRISLPVGLTIDRPKTIVTNNFSWATGNAFARDVDTTANNELGVPFLNDSLEFVEIRSGQGVMGLWDSTFPFTWTTGDALTVSAKFPITEWSA